jgi:hypothetical protein
MKKIANLFSTKSERFSKCEIGKGILIKRKASIQLFNGLISQMPT